MGACTVLRHDKKAFRTSDAAITFRSFVEQWNNHMQLRSELKGRWQSVWTLEGVMSYLVNGADSRRFQLGVYGTDYRNILCDRLKVWQRHMVQWEKEASKDRLAKPPQPRIEYQDIL